MATFQWLCEFTRGWIFLHVHNEDYLKEPDLIPGSSRIMAYRHTSKLQFSVDP